MICWQHLSDEAGVCLGTGLHLMIEPIDQIWETACVWLGSRTLETES